MNIARIRNYYTPVVLLVLIHCVSGCMNLQHEARKEYEGDPVIGVHYDAERDATIYDTRTMNLEARNCDDKRCLLNFNATVICGGQPSRTSSPRAQYLNFRSLSPRPRFLDERTLTFTIDGHFYDMGNCTHNGMKNTDGGVVDDLSVQIEKENVLLLANADTVRGTLGKIRFEIVREELSPVQRLVAAAGCLNK